MPTEFQARCGYCGSNKSACRCLNCGSCENQCFCADPLGDPIDFDDPDPAENDWDNYPEE